MRVVITFKPVDTLDAVKAAMLMLQRSACLTMGANLQMQKAIPETRRTARLHHIYPKKKVVVEKSCLCIRSAIAALLVRDFAVW